MNVAQRHREGKGTDAFSCTLSETKNEASA